MWGYLAVGVVLNVQWPVTMSRGMLPGPTSNREPSPSTLATLDDFRIREHLTPSVRSGERLCRCRRRTSQLAKSKIAFVKTPYDHWFPSALDDPDGSVHRAAIPFGVARTALLMLTPREQCYFKVPSCGSLRTSVHSRVMASPRLFRVIVPVSSIEEATVFYSAVLDQPGRRISPGRHYFGCGGTILACFDPRADGDSWDAAPNPDHVYFAVDDLEEYLRRVDG